MLLSGASYMIVYLLFVLSQRARFITQKILLLRVANPNVNQ